MARLFMALSLCVVMLSACGKKAEETHEAAKTEEAAKPAEAGITKEALAANYNLEKGKEVYEATCQMCHNTGISNAPVVGTKDAWTERTKQGMETMIKKSIEGYQGESGQMPAKGGNAELTDEQVGNAVAYMVEASI
ncbi:cytochrome c class I [Chloroherpeton thalassium ATCC 35110]|uniref:Cytochrome c class I n=1 Tax=Chloroherpeton thalassium (strain ATCC 35110 / GB-78) TaxID=517418 RepID=B3QWA5_CHLT3|nr:c-type cytochrome [Chloroherpeton thalassium]ACF13218.1 cytochrome c class I [Chloroherpeton thalassium ATCC 35110]